MSNPGFAALLLVGTVLSSATQSSLPELAKEPRFSVLLDGERLRLVPSDGRPAESVEAAWGRFSDSVDKTGWSYLEVHTNGSLSNEQQALAAGYLEVLAPLDSRLQAFIEQNVAWMTQQIKQNPNDEYWRQVNLLELQLRGLMQGYKEHAAHGEELDAMTLRGLTLQSELGDIAAGIFPEYETPEDPSELASHCSALLKLLPDRSELFISQVTWTSFCSMLRTYKLYDFPFSTVDGRTVPAQRIAFSSYPGVLYSGDDFYQMSSGLVSQETTIGVYDASLYKKFISTQTVPEWTRNMLANRMARDSLEWCQLFEKWNSGTYNNEWMVLNYNQFQPGRAMPANTFMVLDQIPGHVEYGDLTKSLSDSLYFPSFNVAFWPRIFNLSGAPAMVAQFGNWFSHDQTARALIFQRDHSKVVDLDSMKRLMRYDDFQNDPLSRCDGCNPPYTSENSISVRGDLNPANGTWPISAFGQRNHAGTDAKITNKALMSRFQAVVISGPTAETQPVFVWSTSPYANVTHLGMPDRWNFDWVTMDWP